MTGIRQGTGGMYVKKEQICNAVRNLGDNLQFICGKEGLSNRDFASKLNYDRIRLSKLFLGEQNVKLSTAKKMARATGYSLPALLNISFREDPEYRKKEPYRENDFMKLFVYFVKEKMKEEEMTQADICCYSGMDKAALSRILSNQEMDPTLKTMEKITHALGYELNVALKEETR